MRFKLSIKLTLAFALLAIVVALITALQSFSVSRSLIISDAQLQLKATNKVLATRLENTIVRSENLALFLASNSHLKEFNAPGDREERRASIRELFESMLNHNPNFMSISFIDARNYNRQLIHFHRQGSELRNTPVIELKEKSHFPFVFKTLRLKEGQSYRSPITMGKVEDKLTDTWHRYPSFKTSTPVYQGNELIGLLAIDVDLGQSFENLKQGLPKGTQLYLANAKGDYLIHPDSDKQFRFLLGDRYQLQRDFVALADLIQNPREISFMINERFDLFDLTAGAFLPVTYNPDDEKDIMFLGLIGELHSLQDLTQTLVNDLLKFFLVITFASVIVAMIFGSLISKPLILLLTAMRSLKPGQTHDFSQLAINRSDEIGALSRSFKSMAQQIDNQLLELETQRQNFEHLSRHDPLTGLPNRAYFLSILNHDIANNKRARSQLAVVFIDLDNFKPINDLYGHDCGDALLKVVALELRASLREVDTVARFAGDEFLLILNGVSDQSAVASVLDHLLQRLAKPRSINGHQISVYASVGVSLYPQDQQESSELIMSADKAMYAAKQEGRNRYCFHNPETNKHQIIDN